MLLCWRLRSGSSSNVLLSVSFTTGEEYRTMVHRQRVFQKIRNNFSCLMFLEFWQFVVAIIGPDRFYIAIGLYKRSVRGKVFRLCWWSCKLVASLIPMFDRLYRDFRIARSGCR
jgi:hypothetical protein